MMKNKIDWKRPECVATLSAFFAGIAVHMFGLVNVLHNHDDIGVQPNSYGAGIASGRWGLEFLGDLCKSIFGGYDLPWVNGILFILFVAITVGIIVSIFGIKNKKNACIIGMVFVSFPTITATMLYRFTAGYYGVAIILAVLSAWFLTKFKHGFLISVLCSALSLGIYQAYIPLTISILVLYLIMQLLQEKVGFWHAVCRGVYYCCAILLGLLLYMLVLKVCLKLNNIELNEYKGINTMGQLNLGDIPRLVWQAIKTFCYLPSKDYVGLAQTDLLKKAYLWLGVFTAAMGVIMLITKKLKIAQIILLSVLCVVFPIAVNFIMIMCPDTSIHTLMVYAFAIVPCVPLVLVEAFPTSVGLRNKLQRVLVGVVTSIVVVIVICNAYIANVNYTALYYANRQAENYLTSVVTQVRMTEGFDSQKKWVFIGKINDPLLNNPWQEAQLYGGNMNSCGLLTTYSWQEWINHRYGYNYPVASQSVKEEIQTSDEVSNMPCWPNEGSVKIIGDNVVIKFS